MPHISKYHRLPPVQRPVSRREFLWSSGGGLGGIALAGLLGNEPLPGAATSGHVQDSRGDESHAAGQPRQFPAKAKRVIQLFMAGAASHIDLFDYKPELVKRHGQPSDFGEHVEAFQDGLGPWLQPVWKFRPHGETGKMLSDVVAPLGDVVDELSFVHNVVGKTGVHSQATLLQTSGFNRPGFPSGGAWVSYGLGNANENLPTFVVLPDARGFASNGVQNWDCAFLPSENQGVIVYPGRPSPIADLRPADQGDYVTRLSDAAAISALKQLNAEHAETRSDDPRLEARIRSYELAARMQLAAPEALDTSDEPEHILRMYGLDNIPESFDIEINAREETIRFGQKCLAARRLIERGVRFVQIWSGNDNGFPRRNWDSHEDIQRDHGPLARGMAHATAALIKDLRQRGLLDETLILWTTEFGRMPSSQGGKGRDHNPYCFTNWLCGGGVKPGVSHGPSDEFGYKPADRDNPTQGYDIHATVLRLLGFDHKQLTVRHGGIDRRLTDVHGHVIEELIA